MKTFLGLVVAVAAVIGIIAYTRSDAPKTRDLARDACENIVEQCEAYADPGMPERADIGSCIRTIDADLSSEPRITRQLATCMADADSCAEIASCGFTVGIHERLRRR